MIRWDNDKKQFLKDNVKGITEKELLKRFNEHFGCNASLSSVNNQKNKLKLSNGIVGGRFEKGRKPFNKGKCWEEYMSKKGQQQSLKTTFKKGNIPFNRREVFDERISKDGYIEIKVQDGKLNDNWQMKHRYIYEQEHGEIPKGYKVVFADSDKYNFDKDNLILVSNAEELIMNRKGLIYEDKDLTKTGALVAKVINAANKKVGD